MYEQRYVIHQECTPFCEQPCEHSGFHHRLLIALLNSSSEEGFAEFKKRMSLSSRLRTWNRDDPIPDPCVEFRYPVVHWAAVLGKVKVLKWCIRKGFDVKKRCGRRGETALHRLAICGYSALQEKSQNICQKFEEIVDLLEQLLESRDDNQDTPLHVATKVLVEQQQNIPVDEHFHKIYPNLVKILIQKTYELNEEMLNSQNIDGNTPLHILAASNKCLKVVKMMLQYGANCDLKNRDGQNPLDIAEVNQAHDITELFSTTGEQKDVDLVHENSTVKTHSDSDTVCIEDGEDDNFDQNDNFKHKDLEDLLQSIRNELPENDHVGDVSTSGEKAVGFPKSYRHTSEENAKTVKRKSSRTEKKEPAGKKLKEKVGPRPTMTLLPSVFIPPVSQLAIEFGEESVKNGVSQATKSRTGEPDVPVHDLLSANLPDPLSTQGLHLQPQEKKHLMENDRQRSKDNNIMEEEFRDEFTEESVKNGLDQVTKGRTCRSDMSSYDDLFCAKEPDPFFTQSLHFQPLGKEQSLEKDPQTLKDYSLLEEEATVRDGVEGSVSSLEESREHGRVAQEPKKSAETLSYPRKQKRVEEIINAILHQKMAPCEKDNHHIANITTCQAPRDDDDENDDENETELLTTRTQTHEVPPDVGFNHQMTDPVDNTGSFECEGICLVNTEGSFDRSFEVDQTKPFEVFTAQPANWIEDTINDDLGKVDVKSEKQEDTTQSSANTWESILDIVSSDDVTELLRKSRSDTKETIERLNGEYEDAERSERIQYQEYVALRKRIKRTEENIKQELEQIAEWRKQANVYLKGRESATRKKISCKNQIVKEKEKLPRIEKLMFKFR